MTLLLRATSPDLLPPVDAAVPHQRTAADSTALPAPSTAQATDTADVAEATPTTSSDDTNAAQTSSADASAADTSGAAPAAESETVAPGPSVAALPAPRIPTSEAEATTAPSDETSDADQSDGVLPDETMGEAPVAGDDADPASPSAAIAQTVQVQRGDTLITVLVNAGVSHDDAYSAIEALQDLFAPKDLRPGQEIALTFSAPEKQHQGPIDFQLVSLSLQPSVDRDLQVTRALDGGFTAFAIDKPLTHRNVAVRGEIHSSLFEAAQDAGVPVAIISAAIKALSYDVDFQRDIQPGDTFEFVFDRLDDEDGNLAKPGDLLYASITLSGKTYELYRYEMSDGFVDYFNPKGESVRKALLRTPVDGARITSGYGMRNHPILGYSTMHKGVDFGAPTGTPIFAAGDGVITKIGPFSSYGNYMQIKHNATYATAYAHISRFAKGLHVGSRVHQGDIIAYVGATGRATGPHLHFEVLVNGSQVNPTSVKLPSGSKLAGNDLKKFKAALGEMIALKEQLEAEQIQTAEGTVQSPDCSAAPNYKGCQ
ncbi:peptidoglycan DD-metalloendopeptidase family protein [Hypericibacter sp.]|uniref:M23 family metallopeptidase n=1 Tax=Hypericibacter sp. TaxID=2705401 RepID=UPI003D6CDB68